MRLFECQNCGAKVELPDEVPAQVRGEAVSVAERSRIEAINYLRTHTPLGLKESKAASFHLARPGGRCHRCETVLPDGGEVSCQKCRSFNLNW